jgi:hypothetical protein
MAAQIPKTERRAWPQFFRFSIRQLLVWTAFVALACVALRSSTQIWISGMHAAALGSLVVAILLAIYRSGPTRAYWVGFAICGWLYVAVLCFSWSLQELRRHVIPFDQDQLLTTWLSKRAYQYAYPYTAQRPQVAPFGGGMGGMGMGMGGGMGGSFFPAAPPLTAGGVPEHEFVNTAHAFWTLLLAACGGGLSRWLFLTREREP